MSQIPPTIHSRHIHITVVHPSAPGILKKFDFNVYYTQGPKKIHIAFHPNKYFEYLRDLSSSASNTAERLFNQSYHLTQAQPPVKKVL